MNIGTRQQFVAWLRRVKKMTYTKYTTLSPSEKQKVQAEYRG